MAMVHTPNNIKIELSYDGMIELHEKLMAYGTRASMVHISIEQECKCCGSESLVAAIVNPEGESLEVLRFFLDT